MIPIPRHPGKNLSLTSPKTLLFAALVIGVCGWITCPKAEALTRTWGGATGGDWSVSTNWSQNTLPTSSDTALFNSSGYSTVANAVSNQSVTSISFDKTVGSVAIGATNGNSLLLTSGGTIQLLNTLTTTGLTETINSPIVIGSGAANQSYTFSNNYTNDNTSALDFAGGITAGTTAVSNTTTLTLSGGNTAANTISGVISNSSGGGPTALSKSGAGTWILTGSNTYTGATAISAGTLELNAAGAISDSAIVFSSGGTGTVTESVNNAISGSASVTIASNNHTLTLADSNNYRGGTSIGTNDTLNYGNVGALGSGAVNFGGVGTLQAGVNGTLANNVTIAASTTATIDTQGNTVTLSGTVSGSSATHPLTKIGSGELILSNTSDVSVGTTVSAGTLFVSGSLSGTSAVVNVNGGTLGGSGVLSGSTAIASAATLNPGAGLASTTTLTINNAVSFNTGSTFEVNVDAAGNTVDKLTISGSHNLNLNGTDTLTFNLVNGTSLGSLANGTYAIASFANGNLIGGAFTTDGTLQPNWSIVDNSHEIDLVVVPEPATWAMFLGGLGTLMVAQRMRRRRLTAK